ncbi:hypothetical protein BROUX41_005113 [Berkeleyomyces rouxiae]|uniref:uncharacterized protein n=1 Tax=Berkeleyomyces rouxiae TaxID=2035830 RepID=UPI003B81C6BF
MKEFMEAVQQAFYDATGWHRDNSYSSLDATADGLLNFHTPQGLHMTLSALATPQFATSYELGTIGVVDGSLSYLYSSVPVQRHFVPQSEKVSLPSRMQSYRALSPLNTSFTTSITTTHASPNAAPTVSYPSLLYGRLYLPQSMLEALVVKKLSPALQVQLSAVSSKTLRNGGTVLGLAQYDVGRYAVEGLASSDGGLLGLRGIYNFHAHDEKAPLSVPGEGERERIFGRFSTGAEIYYGTLNKGGGISLGARFATLPEHMGTPLTATLTINPLMGSISASYAVMAGKLCTLGTRLDFNVYSYESDWLVGIELWRKGFPSREAPMFDHAGQDKSIIPPQSPKTVSPKRAFNQTPAECAKIASRKLKSAVGQTPGSIRQPASVQATPNGTSPAGSSSSRAVGFQRSFQAKMEWRLDETSGSSKSLEANIRPPSPPQTSSAPSSPPSTPSTPAPASISVDVTPPAPGPASLDKSQGLALGESISTVAVGGDGVTAAVVPLPVLNAFTAPPSGSDSEEYSAVVKARLDQNLRIGLLWEGRVKALLFGLGFAIDLRRRDQPFRTVGLEVQYSS